MTDIATSTVLYPVLRNERYPRRKYDTQKEFNLIRFVVKSYRQRDADEPNNNALLVFGVYEGQVKLVLAWQLKLLQSGLVMQ